MYINVSRSGSPQIALVLASSFNCNVHLSYVHVCVKFHKDSNRFRRGFKTSKLIRGCILFD